MTRRAPLAVLTVVALVGLALELVANEVAATPGSALIEYALPDDPGPLPVRPGAITTAADGTIWLADSQRPVLKQLDAAGEVSATVDLSASAAAGMQDLVGTPDGAVWATVPDDHLIVRTNPSGAESDTTVTLDPDAEPWGITVDGTGRVWVVDRFRDELIAVDFDPIMGSATPTIFPLPSGSAPTEVELGPDDHLWIAATGAGEVLVVDPTDGSVAHSYATTGAPSGLAFDREHRLWYTATASDRIGRIDPTDGASTSFTLTSGSAPGPIGLGADGNLWFGAGGRNRIGRITPVGAITTWTLPTSPSQVVGLARDGAGWWWGTVQEGRVVTFPTEVALAGELEITGTAAVGQTLTRSTPAPIGTQPITTTVQWRRCNTFGSACADIPGATGDTYLVGSADAGATLRVAVTGTNPSGSNTIVSEPTAVVPPPPPPPTTTTTTTAPPPPPPPPPTPVPPPPTPAQIQAFWAFVLAILARLAPPPRCRKVNRVVRGRRVVTQVCTRAPARRR
jgi:virginiamycin B lyase